MSAVSAGGGSKRTLAIVLGVIGVLFIILAILYFAGVGLGPLNTIGHHGKANHGSHGIRGSISAGVGVILLIGAWITSKKN